MGNLPVNSHWRVMQKLLIAGHRGSREPSRRSRAVLYEAGGTSRPSPLVPWRVTGARILYISMPRSRDTQLTQNQVASVAGTWVASAWGDEAALWRCGLR